MYYDLIFYNKQVVSTYFKDVSKLTSETYHVVSLSNSGSVWRHAWPPAGPLPCFSRAAMFQIKNRIRYSSPGIAAAKLFSSGPTKNPVVFLDIQADSESLGRIIIEVAKLVSFSLSRTPSLTCSVYQKTPACASEVIHDSVCALLSCSWMQM